MDEEWQNMPGPSLREGDANVLQVIDEEDLSSFTFEGLKRRLRIHPETLSRVLHRLEDQGFVERGLNGYKVYSKPRDLLGSPSPGMEETSVPLLQTLLPRDVPVQKLVSSLRGKWFGMLRWLGSSESHHGVTLKWITEDGRAQVDANFSHGELNIEAKLLGEKDTNFALMASYQLIGYILRFYSKRNLVRQITYFGDTDAYFTAA